MARDAAASERQWEKWSRTLDRFRSLRTTTSSTLEVMAMRVSPSMPSIEATACAQDHHRRKRYRRDRSSIRRLINHNALRAAATSNVRPLHARITRTPSTCMYRDVARSTAMRCRSRRSTRPRHRAMPRRLAAVTRCRSPRQRSSIAERCAADARFQAAITVRSSSRRTCPACTRRNRSTRTCGGGRGVKTC
jgi:hypothetical protein